MILKPAEDTPGSATLLARLAVEAGFPPGVLNVLHGYGPGSAGQALTEHPGVDRITFTGESGTGRSIAGAAAAHLTPVSLELGGKGANLVFADADLSNAVSWSIRAIFSNAGQVCLAGSRLFIQQQAYEEFLGRFVAAAESLRLGDPKTSGTQLGPLASAEQSRQGHRLPEHGRGGRGEASVTGGAAEGWFDPAHRGRGRTPGQPGCAARRSSARWSWCTRSTPRRRASRWRTTPGSGSTPMVFTESLGRAHRVAAALDAGTVWVNCFFIRDLRAPFGGTGDSGVGREGGTFSQEFFTEPKAVVMQIPPGPAGLAG